MSLGSYEVIKMKCHKCKRDFDISQLTTARNEKGKKSISKTANLYCSTCELEQYNNALLVDYLHQWFIYKGYYDTTNNTREAKKRYMGLVNTQISNLLKNGYSSVQIKLICEFMLEKEGLEFTDSILGLVPYYFTRVSEYHTELFRISTSKKFGYIQPTTVEESKRRRYKPDRSGLRITNMETL